MPAEAEDLSKLQGTGTSFSPLALLLPLEPPDEPAEPDVDELEPVLSELPELPEVPELPNEWELPELPPEEVNDRTAKSILPELGLMTTSLIVPNCSPEEDLTSEPVNLLARISCWPMRPVAL